MFVHHVRFTSISVLTSEASNIIQCASTSSGREPGDRREVSLTLKSPIIMSQTSLVRQASENVPSVPISAVGDLVKGSTSETQKAVEMFRTSKRRLLWGAR